MDSELKQYLDSRFETFDKKFETVATKDDLAQQLAVQTETLKAYADEQTEKLAAIINTTIAEPMEQNFSELKDYKTVKEEVSILKSDVKEIKTVLHLN
jgi:uncharacterized protein YicC (UPF0701 family)